tara:strand:+ start:547 stop:912 length:366 start_codon:yes stop_codon:yes gene_type:complete
MDKLKFFEAKRMVLVPFVCLALGSGCGSESFFQTGESISPDDPGPAHSAKEEGEAVSMDYEKIREIMSGVVNSAQSQVNQAHYQFICDENERWIYRCNMRTGEIECFSMSSNKLRLLSSIK